MLGLRSKLDKVASTLSQGEKKLLDIASAFALNPTVILPVSYTHLTLPTNREV